MGTISALLELQSMSMKNPEAAEALIESHGRVSAMMRVYDKLTVSGEYKRVRVRDYLTDLIASINSSFGNKNIIIETDIEDIILPIEKIYPIGIIVNEMLTNSYKYAFPEKMPGVIKIRLLKKDDERCSLFIADNGIGSSDESKSGSGGFGIRLVNLLTSQIKGTIKRIDGDGTAHEINFPM